MMRNKASSSMQKTYDECYLICSTAVYFEGQNNEAEALRSWRSALDRIYYHNAYRVAPDYHPRSETERALQESLKDLELQCKERVTLLEALRKSRLEDKNEPSDITNAAGNPGLAGTASSKPDSGFIGQGTIPAVNYPDLARPAPPLPHRPPPPPKAPSYGKPSLGVPGVSRPAESNSSKPLSPNPAAMLPKTSRTPSPEKMTRMKMTLRDKKDDKKGKKPKDAAPKRPQAASKAAGLAWDSTSRLPLQGQTSGTTNANTAVASSIRSSLTESADIRRASGESYRRSNASLDAISHASGDNEVSTSSSRQRSSQEADRYNTDKPGLRASAGPLVQATRGPAADTLPYRKEYPTPAPVSQASITAAVNRPKAYDAPVTDDVAPPNAPSRKAKPPPPPVHRRPVGKMPAPRTSPDEYSARAKPSPQESADETTSSQNVDGPRKRQPRKKRAGIESTDPDSTPSSSGRESPEGSLESDRWEERLAYIKKNLPKGVDPFAAKQIFNDIVVQGDEVHWSDVAGLDAAKTALKEAVVYPFLRPDLFMGLREPARGMLLFGPPGTGKTMLARAVATESRSTFFAISASSLTSKWLGDSEKLVRALFALAKALAPSIIFVDEIDSLLAARGGSSEHETTRRLKTEFLIQWSDLQRAAAGKEQTARDRKLGDASRVLVLAATNTPWAIDEAARRRFVRRQYIPLPEAAVREEQLRTLLSHQKHGLNSKDIRVLVEVTDGYSGSDITALAKDAAMGPLRSLGEALLRMSRDEIRPIMFEDFEASLINIRPSVGKQGLKEFEDWAKEFGERGG